MKKRIFFVLLLVTTILYAAGPYYVHSTLGNDGNAGTFSAPFATVTKALSVMNNTTINTCYIAGTFTTSLLIHILIPLILLF